MHHPRARIFAGISATAVAGFCLWGSFVSTPRSAAQTAGSASAQKQPAAVSKQSAAAAKQSAAAAKEAAAAVFKEGPAAVSKEPAAVSKDGTPAVSKEPAAAISSDPATGHASDAQGATKTATVLPPQQFFGKAAIGYEAAQQIPDLCGKLFCYCGCDITDAHMTLLDCFTSDHGADCDICTGEAVLALALQKQGKTEGEIQKAVDVKYEKEYPFEKPTRALLQYRASRLYKPAPGTVPQHRTVHPKPPPPVPKLKAGKKIGSCCGGGKKHA